MKEQKLRMDFFLKRLLKYLPFIYDSTMARANLNKSEELVTNTTAASKCKTNLHQWVLIVQPKIPQMPQNLLPNFSAQAQKFWISIKLGFLGIRSPWL